LSELKISNEKILQFKLNRDETLIDDGYEALLLCMLYSKNIDSIDEINEMIYKIFNLSSIPTYIIHKYLSKLVYDRSVIFEDGIYKLSEPTRKDLEKISEVRMEINNLINQEIIKIMKEYYENKEGEKIDEKVIINAINEVISKFFTKSAKVFSGYVMGDQKLLFDIPTLENMIELRISELVDEDLKNHIRNRIIEDLIKGSLLISEYLYDQFETYVYFEILNINPETQIKLNIDRIYLDTNILLDLLLTNRTYHNLSTQLVQLSNELYIMVTYTYYTYQEFSSVIDEYNRGSTLTDDALKEWEKRDRGDVIEGYFKNKEKNPSLTFEGFCISLIKSSKERLKQEFNVILDDNHYNEIKKDAIKLEKIINMYSNDLRDYKPKNAVIHDAMCLQIQQLNNTWLITRDRSLFLVSKHVIETTDYDKLMSVHAEVWIKVLTLIRPPTNKHTSVEAFSNFFTSPLRVSFPKINTNKIFAVAFPWIEAKYLSPDDLDEIIQSKFIEDYIVKPHDQDGEVKTFEEIINSVVDETIARKIDRLQQEKEDMNAKIDELVQEKLVEITSQKSEKQYEIKIKPFFYIGVVTSVIFALLILLNGFQIIIIPDTVFYSVTLLIIFFLGGAFFGEPIVTTIIEKIIELLSFRLRGLLARIYQRTKLSARAYI